MEGTHHKRAWPRLLRWCPLITLFWGILAWGASQAAGPAPNRGQGSVAMWMADREGQSLVGLDRHLYVVETRRAVWPVGVLAGGRGSLWTVEAVDASPLGDHRLALWAPGGRLVWEAEVGPVLDLSSDGAGRPLIVEMGKGAAGSDRLLLAEPDRAGGGADDDHGLMTLLERPQLSCAAGREGMVLLGTGDGLLLALRSAVPARILRVLEVGGQIGDIAALDPARDAGWWVLDVASPGRLLRLGSGLGVLWEEPTGIRPMHIIPDPARGSVWAADANEPLVRRWGADGTLELQIVDLPLGGLDRGAILGSGIVLTAPGALLRLDGTGSILPGQGGFHFPVDLAVNGH